MEHFGRWFRQQRELRGISIWFVAARIKMPPERIRAIEEGRTGLKRDGHGRAVARALARAIGADPEEGLARLSRWSPRGAVRKRARWVGSLLRVGRPVAVALVLGLGVWLLSVWFQNIEVSRESPQLVYRPDYVERLLEGDGS